MPRRNKNLHLIAMIVNDRFWPAPAIRVIRCLTTAAERRSGHCRGFLRTCALHPKAALQVVEFGLANKCIKNQWQLRLFGKREKEGKYAEKDIRQSRRRCCNTHFVLCSRDIDANNIY